MWSTRAIVPLAAVACCLAALPLATAHGAEPETSMDMQMAPADLTSSDNTTAALPVWKDFPPNYFRHSGYQGWMLLHIVMMTLAWAMTMPAAIMLSIARSKFHLPLQLVFHAANGLGVLAGFVYNHSTPDLYEVNAHHPLSWAVTSLTIVWTMLSVLSAFNDYRSKELSSQTGARPGSTSNLPGYDHLQQYSDGPSSNRFSRDSGNFSESGSNSFDSIHKKEEGQPSLPEVSDDDLHDDFEHDPHAEKRGFLGNAKIDRMFSRHVKRFDGARLCSAVRMSQIVLEKFLLLLGFVALTTGFVTYGGIFRDDAVFSGLAHYIKGAIFFWYGLLSLGRWMGAFAEFGWAWNARPRHPVVSRWKSVVPSAEFTESFVIWLYGASNVFLEHLGQAGKAWRPQDVEHVSITILFFGGGLFGMLLESRRLRSLMNTSVEVQKSKEVGLSPAGPALAAADEAGVAPEAQWQPTKADNISLNPMPALVIMLLGMMMSAHHQHSMVSTMMHKQWGTLFTGFAMSRIATYCLLYMKPPTSHYPSRPPTELIAAFCLIAGGLLFMNSASDSVLAIETNGLDAMTIFTLTMGLTGIIMAWEIVVFALKGWAQRKERAATGFQLP